MSQGNTASDDPGPFPDNYEVLIASYLKESLKDPYSVRDLSITQPIVTNIWVGVQRGGNVKGWASCVSYNAKNSFGAYVGLEHDTFYMKDGGLMFTPVGAYMITSGC